MSIPAEVLKRIVAIDMPPEALKQVLTVLADVTAADEARKAKDRERKKAERDKSKEIPRTVRATSTESPPDAPMRARDTEPNLLDSKNLSKETPPKGGSKKGPQHPKSLLDGSAQPTKADRELAERYGMAETTFRHEWDKFRTHHVSKGTQFRDWHLAWKTWALGWKDRGARQAGQPGARFSSSGKNGLSEIGDFLRTEIENERSGQAGAGSGSPESGDGRAERGSEALPFEAGSEPFGRVLDFRRNGSGGYGPSDDPRPAQGAFGLDAAWR